MIKKFFSTLLLTAALTIILTNHTYAEEISNKIINVALILDTSGGKFSEPEKVYQTFQNSIDKIFKKEPQFNIIPIDETDPYIQIYREENNLMIGVDDDYTQTNNKDLSLKKKDIEAIGKYFKADYIVYARVTTTEPRFADGVFSVSKKINITLDFRIWSDKKADFVYARRAMKTGSSTSIYLGAGSASHAVERGLKKCLQDIEKNSDKIKTSMIS